LALGPILIGRVPKAGLEAETVFARKIYVEVLGDAGRRPCPVAWLDSFCMRSFTGRSAFDETLPIADGEMEASYRVDLVALRTDLEDWLTRKFGEGRAVRLRLTEK
jgi:hypothetical protein